MEFNMFFKRQQRLTDLIQEKHFDVLAFNAGPSLTYFTGLHFHLMERPIVLLFMPGKEPVLILPELERAKLDQVTYPLKPFIYSENPAQWSSVFSQAGQSIELTGKKIGIEPQQLRLLEFNYLSSAAEKASFSDASGLIGSLRAVKDSAEIQQMKNAVQIAQKALQDALKQARIGMTEKELANELVIQLLKHGSEPHLPFSPIVSSGPNGANPHAQPSERKLSVGDLLIIDWGASWNGYASDLTRTFGVGKVDTKYKHIHDIVQQANAAGREAAEPGAACGDIDKAARTIIEDAGYGPFFSHRTGHGIGMECHEEPYIRADNKQILQAGMTFTVEPGIYLPGENGVRIEDDVLVVHDGVESLSDFPRELKVIDSV